jgi:glycosyltransferase involved in cell wall biosynthesis
VKVTAVIPVGPGHKQYAEDAAGSVYRAWANSKGPFEELNVVIIDDTLGKRGRSASRNHGISRNPSDWYFLLDADDEMLSDAFQNVAIESAATFGAVCLDGVIAKENIYPLTREMLFAHGAKGTLSMGCFVRGDVARATPFDETLETGEDFDFYMRLPDFVKIDRPLVSIGYRKPSAGGPKGYKDIKWREICWSVIDRYR